MAALFVICGLSVAIAAPTQMPSGFYYPTDRTTWTGTNGGETGDPKQPWNDKGTGGRIYGFLDSSAPKILGKNEIGMDIRQPYSSPVYAIADGTILNYFNTDIPKYWCVIIKHKEAGGSDFFAVYGHCRLKSGLSVGSSVSAGETIGYVNEPTNQHLHFGIKMNSDFSTGWGYLELGIDAYSIGWRPPRTWLSEHTPYDATQRDDVPPTLTFTGPAANKTFSTLQHVSWAASDDGSGVAKVTLQWDSDKPIEVAATGTVAIPNGTHRVKIVATDNAGNTTIATGGPYIIDIDYLVVSVAPGVLAQGYFVQKPDGSSGMCINLGTSLPSSLEVGDFVTLIGGTLTIVNGGQVMKSCTVTKLSSGSPPAAIATTADVLLGASSYMGSLVEVTGRVSFRAVSGTYFYVDDSSGAKDGYQAGIRVVCTGFGNGSTVLMPQLGQLVTVTGIKWAANVGRVIGVIQPRSQSDILVRDRAAR